VNGTRLAALVALALAAGACNAIDTAPAAPASTATPAPTAEFSNAVYVRALRVASSRLRGKLPAAADLSAVQSGGATAYAAVIDRYLDAGANPDLAPQLRKFYEGVFLLGEPEDDVDPIDYSGAAQLATFVVLQDRPWSEMVSADYCVSDSFLQTDCPVESAPASMRAGFLTDVGFLKSYGKDSTLNFRRVSEVHQVFDCAVYPSVPDTAAWSRTNADPAAWGCNAGKNGAHESSGADLDQQPCGGDDLADPSNIPSADDPAGNRISKQFQGYQFGIGMACAGCHGSLLPRRLVFTPFDVDGAYSAARTITDVEPKDLVGGDYCGTETPGDPSDDVDPSSADCVDGHARYNGVMVSSPREYGAQMLQEDAFYSCATTRTFDFVMGASQGTIGLQAGSGVPPAPIQDGAVLSKYRILYQSSGWNTRALLRQLFTGHEFLSAQADNSH
jgi:hypothetical protein